MTVDLPLGFPQSELIFLSLCVNLCSVILISINSSVKPTRLTGIRVKGRKLRLTRAAGLVLACLGIFLSMWHLLLESSGDLQTAIIVFLFFTIMATANDCLETWKTFSFSPIPLLPLVCQICGAVKHPGGTCVFPIAPTNQVLDWTPYLQSLPNQPVLSVKKRLTRLKEYVESESEIETSRNTSYSFTDVNLEDLSVSELVSFAQQLKSFTIPTTLSDFNSLRKNLKQHIQIRGSTSSQNLIGTKVGADFPFKCSSNIDNKTVSDTHLDKIIKDYNNITGLGSTKRKDNYFEKWLNKPCCESECEGQIVLG
jgi:hypothetical protein